MMLYIGVNPMVSHGHITRMFNPAVTIREVARRGEVWTIDPLRTETAKFSTRHIQPWPGKDYAILAWLVREILDGGPIDLAQPVDGMDALRALLADYDLASAADIAGRPEENLTALLAAIRRAGHVTIETGTGTGMSPGMNLTQWLAWVLMILTGRMNRKGGLWFHPGFVTPMDPAPLPVMLNPFTPGPPTRPELPGIIGEYALRGAARRDFRRQYPLGDEFQRRAGPRDARRQRHDQGAAAVSTCWRRSMSPLTTPPRYPPMYCRPRTSSSAPT